MGKIAVSVIAERDVVEIQWGRQEPAEGQLDGYVLIHPNGTLTFPFRDDEDNPFVLLIEGNGVTDHQGREPVRARPASGRDRLDIRSRSCFHGVARGSRRHALLVPGVTRLPKSNPLQAGDRRPIMAKTTKLETIGQNDKTLLAMSTEQLLLDGSPGAKDEIFRRQYNKYVKRQSA